MGSMLNDIFDTDITYFCETASVCFIHVQNMLLLVSSYPNSIVIIDIFLIIGFRLILLKMSEYLSILLIMQHCHL